MIPDDPLKLVSQLLDLPLLDCEGSYCGVVDDIDLDGRPGEALAVKALLVGPGAWRGRMPAWLFAIVKAVAGDRVTRVPMSAVRRIDSFVQLTVTANELGLHVAENKARRLIPRAGAM